MIDDSSAIEARQSLQNAAWPLSSRDTARYAVK
jgi:hypothetical protein